MAQPTTTPTAPLAHGSRDSRGLELTPSSTTESGRFGRMFRNLATSEYDPEILVALGRSMIQDPEEDKELGVEDEDENSAKLDGELRLPAGYTYFGQFVDHDITFDPVSSLTRQNDPDALTNFRTPRFDLDSLYGRGPSDQPYLYEPDGVHLALGRRLSDDPPFAGPDLQRVPSGRATIGDPRNDENLIVSQLQSAFLRFHNAALDRMSDEHPSLNKDDVLKLAQQQVRWHYQWVVVHDYLRRLVGDEVIADILRRDPFTVPGGRHVGQLRPHLRFYHWRERPYLPVEFSVAAYRFGHSIVRPSYFINEVARTDPPIEGVHRIRLFSQHGGERQHLNGFRALPSDWGVQWEFFLPHIQGAGRQKGLPQPSYKLDAELSNPLGALPDKVAQPELLIAGGHAKDAQDLAVRNLLRGMRLGLPSGPDVARAMGVEPLDDEQLFDAVDDHRVRDHLAGRAPLWFYILKEAEVQTHGAHLGAVGGRIVAEVLIGLLAGDPLSFLRVQPGWTPWLEARSRDTFTLSDLINLAQA